MKKLNCIIGIPRSGTTLISNYLSFKNQSICFIEPIWLKISQNRFPKVYQCQSIFKDVEDPCLVIGVINNYLLQSSKDLCYIKETFQINEITNIEIIKKNIELFNEIIILKRNIFFLFSAWKRSNLGREYEDVEFFIDTLLKFYNFFSCLKNKKIIYYEEFCFENFGQFYEPIESFFGDNICKKNKYVKFPNCDILNLSFKEIKKLKYVRKFL